MNEMKQRMADVLCERYGGVSFEQTSPKGKRALERDVDALLEAMEPTMDMKLAGAEAINKQMRGPGEPADYDAATDCWAAMRRKALKDD